MNREQKREVVKSYADLFGDYGSEGTIVLVEYAGINVSGFKALRNNLTKSGGHMVVVKNRLAKIALSGTDCEFLSEYFSGPISVAYSKDPISLTKSLMDFAKDNEALKVKFGVMDGKNLNAKDVKALSELPSLDVLRSKLLSLIISSPRSFAYILNEFPSRVARVVKAKSQT